MRYLLVLVATLVFAPAATAQVFSPTYMAPQGGSEMGVVVASGPGDLSVEWLWRRGFGSYDVGLRGGLADVGDAAVLLGGEFRAPFALPEADPLDLAFTAGAQVALGDAKAFGLQGGVSIGGDIPAEGMLIRPYLHPRIALIDGFEEDDDASLKLQADLGADLILPSGLILRAVVMLADDTMVGFGVSWR